MEASRKITASRLKTLSGNAISTKKHHISVIMHNKIYDHHAMYLDAKKDWRSMGFFRRFMANASENFEPEAQYDMFDLAPLPKNKRPGLLNDYYRPIYDDYYNREAKPHNVKKLENEIRQLKEIIFMCSACGNPPQDIVIDIPVSTFKLFMGVSDYA